MSYQPPGPGAGAGYYAGPGVAAASGSTNGIQKLIDDGTLPHNRRKTERQTILETALGTTMAT